MTEQRRKPGRPKGTTNAPKTKTLYQLAAEYERRTMALDKREAEVLAEIKTERDELERTTPQHVRKMVALNLAAQKLTTEPETPVVTAPAAPAPEQPRQALTTSKPSNGKANGASAAHA